ncbi:hypothetical protein [Streptomyces sp. ME19-01-6]|uniref:hypothetical protein n=1 Tax=Streptomyces sp. ME19-01-6 TaxID=3028686 RepID=UPI0029B9538F|nr:hypothetical protein [Streptomyces sp. ME19-01-6]MDX3233181.1 hypothetical protein [Streptomyces sp. ME19-01-6]
MAAAGPQPDGVTLLTADVTEEAPVRAALARAGSMEDAAEAIASSYIEASDLVRIGDRCGNGCSGRAFAMP